MDKSQKNLRTCPNGHQYYKTSSCPVCPMCEKEREPESAFLKRLSAPARRALESAGLTSLSKLSEVSVADIMKLHGMGPGSIPRLKEALEEEGLGFRE